MPTPKEYREELRTACEKCKDKYEAKIDTLDKQNVILADLVTNLECQRDKWRKRYEELVETVSARTDQRQSLADPRD
jgi:predicted nuclease with TOPRIM domain